jgi:hypothetical protein
MLLSNFVTKLNKSSFFIGLLAALGVTIVGNFQVIMSFQ